ncbi:MAG TPA: hypothetical protein VK964_07045 [Nocardioidaceae bacterium]|nr:hypothetical protein [Nocardioidaceae bacterium]
MTTFVPPHDRLELADVRALLVATSWPSVSVLLDTTSGPHMQAHDARRLRDLLANEAMGSPAGAGSDCPSARL